MHWDVQLCVHMCWHKIASHNYHHSIMESPTHSDEIVSELTNMSDDKNMGDDEETFQYEDDPSSPSKIIKHEIDANVQKFFYK